MQIVTVNLPKVYIDAIATLTTKGLYPSRSEAIRVALRKFLKKELKMVDLLLSLEKKDEKKKDEKKKDEKKNINLAKIDMRTIRYGWPDKKK